MDAVDEPELIPLNRLASPQVRAAADVEEVPLNMVPGLGNEQDGGGGGRQDSAFCCNDRHYRRLAVCSIVCGCSCIGYRALIDSVKAETMAAKDPEAALTLSRRAKKLSIISIGTFIFILALIPALTVLISYVLTFIN
uniref:Uncharacterized protein n=2 Tax=Salarias fasciatus TaxID=181472 RepID=A0A672H135_SALFA